MTRAAVALLALLLAGCAAKVGAVSWAVGDAYVCDGPAGTQVRGGPLSDGLVSILRDAVDGAARFFHADPPLVVAESRLASLAARGTICGGGS